MCLSNLVSISDPSPLTFVHVIQVYMQFKCIYMCAIERTITVVLLVRPYTRKNMDIVYRIIVL